MKKRRVFLAILVITACIVGLAVVSSKPSLRSVKMSIDVTGAKLEGTLFLPPQAKTPVPVVVLLHGSGPDGRTNSYYNLLADQIAKVGYATFIYDKRGSGLSTGNLMSVPFQNIIDDAVTVVKSVRARPETDDNRVVVWGGSEGGSIAPEVAVRSKANAVMTQSASGVPFWIQNRYQNLLALRRDGLSRAQIDAALQAHSAAMHFARTGKEWAKFEQMRNSGNALPIRNGREDAWWAWYRTKMDYEPTQWLKQAKMPILAMWGRQDVLVPVDDSVAQFKKALSDNRSKTFLVFNPANHSMSHNGQLVQLQTISDWLRGL